MKEHNGPLSLDDVLDTVLPDNHPLKTQDMKHAHMGGNPPIEDHGMQEDFSFEFKPGEYCKFPNSEIPAMIDLLRENGHPVWKDSAVIVYDSDTIICVSDGDILATTSPAGEEEKELSPSEFLHKATRGKGVPTISENVPVEFDSSKPFEVSNNEKEWLGSNTASPYLHYVGIDHNGLHVIETDLGFGRWKHVRNVQPEFTAVMLEVGEYMETGPRLGDTQLIKRISLMNWIEVKTGQGTFGEDLAKELKGRRVRVNITSEEV